MLFIVQGSSRSWAGDKDHCMYEIDGKPAIYHTIKRIYDKRCSYGWWKINKS